jgi:hypothetical protein
MRGRHAAGRRSKTRELLVVAAAALLWLGQAAGLERLDADVVRILAQRGLSPPAMDLDQVERTKRHYDAHAKAPAGSRKDALRQRQQVPPRPCRAARTHARARARPTRRSLGRAE